MTASYSGNAGDQACTQAQGFSLARTHNGLLFDFTSKQVGSLKKTSCQTVTISQWCLATAACPAETALSQPQKIIECLCPGSRWTFHGLRGCACTVNVSRHMIRSCRAWVPVTTNWGDVLQGIGHRMAPKEVSESMTPSSATWPLHTCDSSENIAGTRLPTSKLVPSQAISQPPKH